MVAKPKEYKVNRLANYVMGVDIDWYADFDNPPAIILKLKPSAILGFNDPDTGLTKIDGGFWWKRSGNTLYKFGRYDLSGNPGLTVTMAEASKIIGVEIVQFQTTITLKRSNGRLHDEVVYMYTDIHSIRQCIESAKMSNSVEMYKIDGVWCPKQKHHGEWVYKVRSTKLFTPEWKRSKVIEAGLEMPRIVR